MWSADFLFLLHGEFVVGLTASFLFALVIFPFAALWLWKYPRRTPVVPAVIYFLVGTLLSAVFVVLNNVYLLMISVAFSFPWSFLFILLSTIFEFSLGESILFLGVLINAFLIYQIGKASNNRVDLRL